MGHLVIEGDETNQGGPAFHKPILAGPDPLVVLRMLCDHTQDGSLHNLSQYQSQADRCEVPHEVPGGYQHFYICHRSPVF